MEPLGLVERLGRWASGRGPLHALLATRLRALIDEGVLAPGARLPADRALAAALAVSRNTVVAAYEELAVQGRIVRRRGSGTRVAGSPAGPERLTTEAPAFLHLLEPRDGTVLLACAAPDAPPPELIAAYQRILPALARTENDIGYHPAGHAGLREAIAEHYRQRGLPTAPGHILVTTGGQHALSLLARALVRPGDRVLLEAPTYPGALEALREESAVLRALPVGLDGFAAAVAEHRPALAYLVATFQNPTGAILPALDRQRLAQTAARAGVPLIDDEVLAALSFPGSPGYPAPVDPPAPGSPPGSPQPDPAGPPLPPPVAAFDDRVITVGSLSKVVWGGLRVGWVRAPEPLVERLARIRAVSDLGGNIPGQLAAAELLPGLDGLLRRSAQQRQARHDHLRAELARRLPEWQVPAVPGGQTLWVRLPHGDGRSFAQLALRHGVAVLPGSGLDAGGGGGRYLRLHFLARPEDLTLAVIRLAAAWQDYRPRGAAPRAS